MTFFGIMLILTSTITEGGTGQDLIDFLHKYPQSKNRLVLQKTYRGIQAAKETLPQGIKIRAHVSGKIYDDCAASPNF